MSAKGVVVDGISNQNSDEERIFWFLIELHERILQAVGVSASNNLDIVADVTGSIFNINKYDSQNRMKDLEVELGEEALSINGAKTKISYETVKEIYISTKFKYGINSDTAVRSFLMFFHVFRLRFDELVRAGTVGLEICEGLRSRVEDWGLSENDYPLLLGCSFDSEIQKEFKNWLGPLAVAVCLANSTEEESPSWVVAFRQAYFYLPGATLMANSIACHGEEAAEFIKELAALGDFGNNSFKTGIPMCLVLSACRTSKVYCTWLEDMTSVLDCSKIPLQVKNMDATGVGARELWTTARSLCDYPTPKGISPEIVNKLVLRAAFGPHRFPFSLTELNSQLSSSQPSEHISFKLNHTTSHVQRDSTFSDHRLSGLGLNRHTQHFEPQEGDYEIFHMDDY